MIDRRSGEMSGRWSFVEKESPALWDISHAARDNQFRINVLPFSATSVPMKRRSYITLVQAQAAMDAMLKKAMEQPHRPVAMAIVDDAGILIAYQQMDGLRVFTRRHAIRKAYTAAITGMNSGAFGEDCVKARGQTVREVGGDLELTPGHGGVVVRASEHLPKNPEEFHVNVMGGIGVGGYLSGREDEELALVGLKAMNL